jgi:predicted DCC family thiol-disulfide oxidoreductase YuxK
VSTLLLFDADCGFCSRAIGLAPRMRLSAEIASIQSTALEQLGVDPARATREIPAVVDGHVVYGHNAIAAGLLTGPTPSRILGRIVGAPRFEWLFSSIYRWVAAHRHSLPGGSGSCELP